MAKKKFDIGKADYLDLRDMTFNYSLPEDAGIPEMQSYPTQYSMEIVKMFSLEQEVVRLLFTVYLKAPLENEKEVTGLYKTEHLFKVRDLSSWISRTTDGIEINEDLDDALTGVVYSTVRGSLHQKLRGTWFSGLILPLDMPEPEKQVILPPSKQR